MRTTLLSVLAATAALLTTSVALAGPASADHLLGIDPAGCQAGVFTFDVYGDVRTKSRHDVAIHRAVDGTVVATCTFRGLPKQRYNETIGEMWVRPAAGTVREVTACLLLDGPTRDLPGRGDWYGEGTVTFGHGGTATSRCTFDPAAFEGAV